MVSVDKIILTNYWFKELTIENKQYENSEACSKTI
jgi:hypothetical protein